MLSKYSLLNLFVILFLICSCRPAEKARLIIHNAEIYTVNDAKPWVEAIAIQGDRILALGTNDEVLKYQGPETELYDAEKHFVMPGFIEGHGHFSGIGYSLINLNLMNAKSWDEIVEMVAEKVDESKPGDWIVGRGWHQEKWDLVPEHSVFGYPMHNKLSAVSPDNPVMLGHASGHSLFANHHAMNEAGVTVETPDPKGGAIIRDEEGNAVGVFEERAQGLIRAAYSAYLESLNEKELTDEWYKAISLAQEECLSKGITSFQDAGSGFEALDRYQSLAEEGNLDLRLWVMMRESSEQMKGKIQDFRVLNTGNYYYTCRAIKASVDGALGSFGAWLLEPYEDKPDYYGQNTTDLSEINSIAELAFKNQMQFCVHAIGDRANREILNTYENIYSKAPENSDLRWRIEHSQHIHPTDIPRFGQLNVIASMQGIHCTSDAPFVEKRLGSDRAKHGAYAWRSLLDSGAVINNGTDAPVEDVNPIYSLYASVTRKRIDSGMSFYPEQKMTRTEAIKSYTLNNAYAAFEEAFKGSLEEGKLADLVVLSQNLVRCTDEEILKTKVVKTIVGGDVKYSNE